MNGIEKLHPLNHDLYRRVTHLANLRWKWEAICDDIGLVGPRRVMDLCEWMIEYKEPKKLPMVNAGYVLPVPVKAPSLVNSGVRLAVWERQRKGAREALEAAGL